MLICLSQHRKILQKSPHLPSLSQPFFRDSTSPYIFLLTSFSFPSSCHLQQIYMLPLLPQKLQTVDTFPTKWHSNQKAMRQLAVGGKLNGGGHNFHQLSLFFCTASFLQLTALLNFVYTLMSLCVQHKSGYSSDSIPFLCIISSNSRAFFPKRTNQNKWNGIKYMITFGYTLRPQDVKADDPFLQRSYWNCCGPQSSDRLFTRSFQRLQLPTVQQQQHLFTPLRALFGSTLCKLLKEVGVSKAATLPR